ncbi:MAG: glycosyltransferase family 39 protein [Candidatus Thermoplasmatota archaeon]|nr:glycosyltransferase family 39 protein [Candidatus Thermoplasmatota archaeon]
MEMREQRRRQSRRAPGNGNRANSPKLVPSRRFYTEPSIDMDKEVDMGSLKDFLIRNWLVISIVMVGISLRLFFLNHESFWIDEAMTGLRSRWDYPYMFKEISAVDQMPLYFTITWLVARTFGNSVLVLRGLSVIFGVLAFIPVYKIGNRFGRKTAVISLALIAFNPTMIYYSQEAGMYMLMVLLSSISIYLYLEYMNPVRMKRKTSGAFMAITNVALIYIHYFGALFVGLQLLSFLVTYTYRSYRSSHPVLIKGLVKSSTPLSLSLLTFLPWLIFQQTSNSITNKTTGGTLGLGWDLLPGTFTFLGGHYTAVLKYDIRIAVITGFLLVIALIISIVYIFMKKREDQDIPVFIILSVFILFVSPLIVFFLSHNLTPMYNHRYFVFMALPYLMLIAIAISSLKGTKGEGKGRRNLLPVILVVVLLVPSIATDIEQLSGRDKADWKGGIDLILKNQKIGDVVVPFPDHEQMLIYYYTHDLQIELMGAIEDRDQFLDSHGRVWVIFNEVEPIDEQQLIVDLNGWEMKEYCVELVTVRLYVKPLLADMVGVS